ncbi:MAG: TAT-variant-translocated molybdopterin oxidoreductase [Phycisphaerales bacterium]|nr:TAT-variant-translocated molybdopterin oxidoreductase [Phycisphaerales bacterium]
MPPLDGHAITRDDLRGAAAQTYWRSLAEHFGTAGPLTALQAEFPGYDPRAVRGLPRRGFLKLMAASLALGALGCRRWPERDLVPFSRRPEGHRPGVAEYYATLSTRSGVATGIVVKSVDGRPIKIEGNALHPFSGGAADVFAQATVLSLYDPDRSRTPIQRLPTQNGRDTRTVARTWKDFDSFARVHFDALRQQGGRAFAVLAEPTASPTVLRLKAEFLRLFPAARWYTWEPLHRDFEIEGTRLAFGRPLRPQYHLDRAAVVACFGADLLGSHPAHQRHARDWAQQRRSADRGRMSRLYMIEPHYSITGSVADVRLPVRPARVGEMLRAVASRLGVPGHVPIPLSEAEAQFVDRLCTDLQAQRGAALLAVGPCQPPHVHARAHAVNCALDACGQTLTFTPEPLGDEPGCVAGLESLAEALPRGDVQTLLILGGNPMYDAPADLALNLSGRVARDITRIHLSPYHNETSAQCRWHLPMAHELECWGDGRAWDGTYGVQQPLILPLFEGRSTAELLTLLVADPCQTGRDLVRATCRELLPTDDYESAWQTLLHNGVLAGSVWPSVTPPAPAIPPWPEPVIEPAHGFEALFVPDTKLYDGRFANSGWLQELPDPLTKLTWDNAVLISKADADAAHVRTGDLVTLERAAGNGHRTRLEIAALIAPGLASGTLVLPLGYGRTMAGRIGNGVGFDTYALRTSSASYIAAGMVLSRTRRRHRLAMTQEHHLIDAVGMWGREKRIGKQGSSGYLIHEAPLDEYRADRNLFRRNTHGGAALPLFNPPHAFNEPHAWGMAIDLNTCTGCGACAVACQAENNVPIVGRQQVANRREMHWLRIDRYFKGPVENPDVVHVPLACAHCETAPCEQVCPVAATVHDTEGLNVMVYNRCVGTRYCSNNCPFKVRRFNYFDYHATDPRGRPQPWLNIPDAQQRGAIDEISRSRFNPAVTVRMRGVMEKCTYCSHRIQEARVRAKTEWAAGRRASERVLDGEVQPACAAACPTGAIVFGDLNDPESRVSKLRAAHRAYAMLDDLGLRARTQYLAKIRNPASTAKDA